MEALPSDRQRLIRGPQRGSCEIRSMGKAADESELFRILWEIVVVCANG